MAEHVIRLPCCCRHALYSRLQPASRLRPTAFLSKRAMVISSIDTTQTLPAQDPRSPQSKLQGKKKRPKGKGAPESASTSREPIDERDGEIVQDDQSDRFPLRSQRGLTRSRLHYLLAQAADSGDLSQALQLAADLKPLLPLPPKALKDIKLVSATYLYLIQTLAKSGQYHAARALVREMDALEIPVKLPILNELMRAVSLYGGDQMEVLALFAQYGVEPSALTYQYRIEQLCSPHLEASNTKLELALCLRDEMELAGIKVRNRTTDMLIQAAARTGEIRLAYDLAVESPQISLEAALSLAYHAADHHQAEPMSWAWAVIRKLQYTPDRGLLQLMLNCASRAGSVEQSTDLFDLMLAKDLGSSASMSQELSALLEATLRARDLDKAIDTLSHMRSVDCTISPALSRQFQPLLATSEQVDNMTSRLRSRADEAGSTDITLFDALIEATAMQKGASIAHSLLHDHERFRLVPEGLRTETYVGLLKACQLLATPEATDVATRVWTELATSGMSLTRAAYNARLELLLLSCSTGSVRIDEILSTLDAMDAVVLTRGRRGLRPVRSTVVAILRALLQQTRDDRAFEFAKRMKRYGYVVPTALATEADEQLGAGSGKTLRQLSGAFDHFGQTNSGRL
ncbi:uncharacterized protein L969DRAFT_463338 [Mixia osmundae IAM 14324]|uniref:uncharacterized protein n=1 Tax=Mixia osmundae (strain CBS 9802 / IAM 14324 / JCM 22182 / KY 12970) TaxID=764103 RepID=UPI0004A55008|nr:uncharacterized protein L969DRAFT_463338 [Mixia osmundae IAM 14324]KEI39717.1 hypothetical protein L969DRAFT_463338 [Mixia osmundae IAM 14324]